MRPSPPRSRANISPAVLNRLARIATLDLEDRFRRHPRWRPYRERILCVALCQGAAMHYLDGCTGVKDLDVWTFFAEIEDDPFPARWRLERRFDRDPFRGLYVDLIGRSIPFPVSSDPLASLRAYLSGGRTSSARALARKAVVLLEPKPLRGRVAWPPSMGDLRAGS